MGGPKRVMRCRLCPDDNPVRIPFDEVGVELMQQHLKEHDNGSLRIETEKKKKD